MHVTDFPVTLLLWGLLSLLPWTALVLESSDPACDIDRQLAVSARPDPAGLLSAAALEDLRVFDPCRLRTGPLPADPDHTGGCHE